ncbi:hypothetical protein ZWY2020_011132 [Hordeum vulgare]|nr:hypothetical protein ZWY2020_011132 [Hordeum vulgare]
MVATHSGYNVVKMPGNGGVITVVVDVKDASRVLKLSHKDRAETKQVPGDEGSSAPTFTISANLPRDQEKALLGFLKANKDAFDWSASDLVGVPRDIIEHQLMVCPNMNPVKQKARRLAREKQAFIAQEVRKLKEAGLIWEVCYPEWVANPVVVPKKCGKEHMCVDITSLNKACPQDPFPLPRIDQIVDSTAQCDILCFLDAFLG